jgi:hypothetical protein
MAWIELHQAVWTHRKTFELAARLDLDETYAAAHLIRLWTWALDNAPNGDLSSLSARALAFGAGWRGDADALVGALVGSGWLDPDLRIHDWQDYAGRLLARRQAQADRMQRSRANHVTRTSGESALSPDRTGPNRTGPLPPTPSRTAGGETAAEAAGTNGVAVRSSSTRSTAPKGSAKPTTKPAGVEVIEPGHPEYDPIVGRVTVVRM